MRRLWRNGRGKTSGLVGRGKVTDGGLEGWSDENEPVLLPPLHPSSSPTLHFSHHFDRTLRHGVEEGLAVAFGEDAVVEHHDDAAVGLRAKQAPDALTKFEDGFWQRELVERIAAASFDGFDAGLDQRMVGDGKRQ